MSILDYAPTFSPEDAIQIAQKFYNLITTAKSLPSYQDENFMLSTEAGERYVLKIANGAEIRANLEAQNQVMGHLAQMIKFCPQVISSQNGDEILIVESPSEVKHFVRLVTYLPGKPMGFIKRHSPELLNDIGFKLGQLTSALQGLDYISLQQGLQWDFANGLEIVKKHACLVQPPEFQQHIQKISAQFEKTTSPILSSLRKSVVQNDPNEFNLLVGSGDDLYSKDQHIVGLIDFGDMIHSYTVGDLAIAIAYAILYQPDPLTAAAHIVRGYHRAYPLHENELSALFGLVELRLCMSACVAAKYQADQPENEYININQTQIRRTLPELVDIHPRFAEAVFRDACGLTPFPASVKIVDWLTSHADEFASPLDIDLRAGPITVLDLSVSSPLLDSDPAKNAEPHLTPRINAAIAETGAQIGIGRYDEARYFYTSPAFATGDKVTDEYRTIHLGIDLFAPAWHNRLRAAGRNSGRLR